MYKYLTDTGNLVSEALGGGFDFKYFFHCILENLMHKFNLRIFIQGPHRFKISGIKYVVNILFLSNCCIINKCINLTECLTFMGEVSNLPLGNLLSRVSCVIN